MERATKFFPSLYQLFFFFCLWIECSGIHRSMGTHVSKIRSLTLDSSSYSPDILALLHSIGNAQSNAIWEATNEDDDTKIQSTDRRDKKLQYIQMKYVVRAFIQPATTPDEKEDPNKGLFAAIDNDAIPAALRAIVLGANVNSSRDNQYALHLALMKGRTTDNKRLFPMAEFLLQNGADAGIVDPTTGQTVAELIGLATVQDDAVAYLNLKNTARGQSLVYRSSMPPPMRTPEPAP